MRLGGQPCLLRRRVSKRFADWCRVWTISSSVLIDRPPQPMLFAADGDDDLVEAPDIAPAHFLALQAAA